MKIVTKNINTNNIDIKELKNAANYFADKLLTKRQKRNIKVNLSMKNIYDKGYIEWVDKPVFPREFNIVLNNKYKKKQTLITLAHEMVHLKQYVIGELKDATLRSDVKWKREEINEDKMHYFDLPYEIEAYGREYGLFKRYMERTE